MTLCQHCLKQYKRFLPRKKARKLGIPWGKAHWPAGIYHQGSGRLCALHKAQNNARTAQRRALKLQATPKWADRKKIQAIYAESVRLSAETGIPHEVDHIVPLRGRGVVGLHVDYNLRAIPAKENRAKSNRF